MTILGWIRQNASWIFSGIGVFLLVWLVLGVRWLWGRRGAKVSIDWPAQGSRVSQQEFVRGRVNAACKNITIIVHPIGNAGYWIQPPVSVREDGSWTGLAFVGSPDESGGLFEIAAFAGNGDLFRRGEILGAWPRAVAKSNIVEVQRK